MFSNADQYQKGCKSPPVTFRSFTLANNSKMSDNVELFTVGGGLISNLKTLHLKIIFVRNYNKRSLHVSVS